jgi:hypothetical protein
MEWPTNCRLLVSCFLLHLVIINNSPLFELFEMKSCNVGVSFAIYKFLKHANDLDTLINKCNLLVKLGLFRGSLKIHVSRFGYSDRRAQWQNPFRPCCITGLHRHKNRLYKAVKIEFYKRTSIALLVTEWRPVLFVTPLAVLVLHFSTINGYGSADQIGNQLEWQ